MINIIHIRKQKLPWFITLLHRIFFGGSPSPKEDRLRKANILNIILIGSILLAFIASIVNIFAHPTPQYPIFEVLPAVVFFFLYILYIFSRHVSHILSAFILTSVFSGISYYLAYRWGTIVPQSWILLALTIVMSGILISSRFSLFLILAHIVTLLVLTDLQTKRKILYQPWDISPMFGSISVAIATLIVIGIISWLSNHEIEKALHRARGSEKALKKERDLLEVKVEERTKELKKVQLEKVLHLYRFADFGRMSAGLFHDLSNPLNVVSLNLERLSGQKTSPCFKRALLGSRRMKSFVQTIRRQIQKQEVKTIFFLSKEVAEAIAVLNYKAKEERVKIVFLGDKKIRTSGNPLRFNQLVTNLLANSIEAYEKVGGREKREVIIKIARENKEAMLEVQDFGIGISKENLGKIFDPFFTTKDIDKGTGIGLPTCKAIVEKELNGKIKVRSRENKGTTFTVEFPIKHKNTRA